MSYGLVHTCQEFPIAFLLDLQFICLGCTPTKGDSAMLCLTPLQYERRKERVQGFKGCFFHIS